MHFYFRQFNIIDEDIVSARYSHHGFCKTIFLWLVESISGFSVILYAYHHILSVEKCMFLLMGFSCIYPQFILIGCSCVYPQSLLIGFSCACLQFLDQIQSNTPAYSFDWIHLYIPQFILIWFSQFSRIYLQSC